MKSYQKNCGDYYFRGDFVHEDALAELAQVAAEQPDSENASDCENANDSDANASPSPQRSVPSELPPSTTAQAKKKKPQKKTVKKSKVCMIN